MFRALGSSGLVAQRDGHDGTFGGELGRRREAVIATVCFSGAALLAYCAWGVRHETSDSLVVTLTLGSLIILVLAIRGAQTSNSLLDPLVMFSTVFFIYFVLHVIWLDAGRIAAGLPGSGRQYADTLPRSQMYALAAYGALLVGYYATRFRPYRSTEISVHLRAASTPLLVAIFIIGVGANYAGTRLSTASDPTNALLFRTIGYFAFVAFVVALVRHALSSGSDRRVLGYLAYGVMLPIQLLSAFAVSRGSRTDVVFVFVALFSVRTLLVRPVRMRTYVALAVVALLVFIPTLEALRVEALQRSTSVGAIAIEHISQFPSLGLSIPHGSFWSGGWESMNHRTNGGESLALAVKYTPEPFPYQRGHAWTTVAYSFIPHLIWPGKPTANPGREFSINHGGLRASRGQGLTLAPTEPGDLYLNFGLVGLIVGFFLFGIFIRAVTMFATPDPFAILVYVALVTPVLLLERDVAINVAQTLSKLGVTLAFVGIVKVLSPATRRKLDRA